MARQSTPAALARWAVVRRIDEQDVADTATRSTDTVVEMRRRETWVKRWRSLQEFISDSHALRRSDDTNIICATQETRRSNRRHRQKRIGGSVKLIRADAAFSCRIMLAVMRAASYQKWWNIDSRMLQLFRFVIHPSHAAHAPI